jgi:glycolate oxidase FAD binding subunit
VTAPSTATTSPTSVAEVRECVRDAAAQSRPLRIVGGGSWLDANRPVRADDTLVMRRVAGIVEYEPGDLTLTARAGTTLDEIMRATSVHGQWLTLDPYGDASQATIGATIATASYGPLAHHFGTPRDMTLGVEFVTGAGDIVRGGGRVVKNVAGFDLTRLVTGSWGSIGVITEVTLRLRALPGVQATLAIDIGGGGDEIERVRSGLHRMPFVPLAAELLDGALARRLIIGNGPAVLLVRLGGNDDAVGAQCEQLRNVGDAHDVDPTVWQNLRSAEPARAAALRLSRRPSEFAATWHDATRFVEQRLGSYCHGDPRRGVVRIVLPSAEPEKDTSLEGMLEAQRDGGRVYERLPTTLWRSLAPTAIRNRLEHGIKAAFDPRHVLNPGILGEMT